VYILIPVLISLLLPTSAPNVEASIVFSKTLYGCNGGFGSLPASDLYTIDPTTGSATLIGSMVNIVGCSGLRFQPSTGVLFAVGLDVLTGIVSLFTVDVQTGLATMIGHSSNICPGGGNHRIADIAFRSDGVLFGSLTASGVTNTCLGTLSTTTGAVTFIGQTGDGSEGNGLAFDSHDTLWLATSGHLDTLNQATAAATFVAPIVDCGPMNALAFDVSNTLYASLNCGSGGFGPTYLAKIDTVTGAVHTIGFTVDGLDGIAFSPPQRVPIEHYRDAPRSIFVDTKESS